MMYGNYYGAYPYGQNPYYQMMSQQAQQAPVQPQQSGDGKIYVPNEAAANAYMVAPGNTVQLWDSSRQTFYEKTADAQGRTMPMLIYDYALRKPEAEPQIDLSGFVTREELEERLAALKRIPVRRKEVAEDV